jgi:uncharacterized protein (TIGR00730 family)
MISTLCVFCGSSAGVDPRFMAYAESLGSLLAERKITLVYGGGNVGTMGAMADACMRGGGEVVGIIPEKLNQLVDHLDLSELLVVPDMHSRKALMQEKSDAFIALPGGIGTMEELFEVWAWRYIGYHAKPVGILNVAGFYDELLSFLRHMGDQGFIRPDILDDLVISESPDALLDLMEEKVRSGQVPELKIAERSDSKPLD